MKLKKIIDFCDFFYPQNFAEEFDNVGLQLGYDNQEITTVLTALQITTEVVEEAIEKNADLIIVHHPLIFHKLSSLNTNDRNNILISKLIKNDIAVFAMHTNVDSAFNGINDWVMQILGIRKTKVLHPTKKVEISKIELEVLDYQLENLIEILKKIGAGQNGKNLSDITFSPKIKNTIQAKNLKETEYDIISVETNLTDEQIILLKKEITKFNFQSENNLKFNVFPYKNPKVTVGIGRFGYTNPTTIEELSLNVKELFDLSHVRIVGSYEKIVKKIAVCAGSGSDYLSDAIKNNCDVLITGDVGFHTAHDALSNNIAIIDAGHIIELVFNDAMTDFIQLFSDDIKVFSSEINIDPFEVL